MRRRWGLIVAGGLVLASVAGVWTLWRNALGGHSLEEELAAARREGLPVDAKDLIEPAVPDAENGAIPYLRAAELNRQIWKTTAWNRKVEAILIVKGAMGKTRPMASLTPAERKRLLALLAVKAPAFAALREAVARPRFALNRPWHLSYGEVDTDDIRMFGFLVENLALRARLRQVEGDGEGAYADLTLAARAAALLRHGITDYDGYTRRKLEGRILNQAVRWERDPVRLRALVRHLGPPPDLRRTCRSAILTKRRKLAYENATAATSMRLRSVYQATEAHYLAYWRTLSRRLPPDPLAFDAARSAITRTNEEFYPRGSSQLTDTDLDLVAQDVDDLARNEAQRRMALAVADVLEFRHRNHRWPDGLPKPYEDPFGGKLRYRQEGNDFLVYSVDADGQDDGGNDKDFVVTPSKLALN